MPLKEEFFEIPASRKANNFNKLNNSLNISLNLMEPLEQKDRILIPDNNKKFNLNENNKNFLILPLNEDNPFSLNQDNKEFDEESDNNDQFSILNPHLKILKEEYDNLKERYNQLKSFVENYTGIDKAELKEKERLKKKMKKRLKQIKDIFKEKINS